MTKINITLNGTPDQLREGLRALMQEALIVQIEDAADGLVGLTFEQMKASDDRADAYLETAVKNGGVEILLGEVTPERKLAAAGCL